MLRHRMINPHQEAHCVIEEIIIGIGVLLRISSSSDHQMDLWYNDDGGSHD